MGWEGIFVIMIILEMKFLVVFFFVRGGEELVDIFFILGELLSLNREEVIKF